MKSTFMASAAAIVLTFGIGAPAVAATCSDEIAALKQETFTGSVDKADATAKPMAPAADQSTAAAATEIPPAQGTAATQTAAASATAEQEPAAANSASGEAGMSSDQIAAENQAAPGQDLQAVDGAPAAGTLPGTEATAAMNKVTEGIAASPAEVEAQQTAQPAETAPSAEQVAAADQPLPAAAPPTSGGNPIDLRAEMLARAEAYQQLGNDGACMNLVEQAKAVQ